MCKCSFLLLDILLSPGRIIFATNAKARPLCSILPQYDCVQQLWTSRVMRMFYYVKHNILFVCYSGICFDYYFCYLRSAILLPSAIQARCAGTARSMGTWQESAGMIQSASYAGNPATSSGTAQVLCSLPMILGSAATATRPATWPVTAPTRRPATTATSLAISLGIA